MATRSEPNASRATEPAHDGRGDPQFSEVLSLVSGTPTLHNKTVIVTGAGGGIGRVTAQVLAAAGASVAITDLTEELLKPVHEELRAAGADPLVEAIDASDFASFRMLCERTAAELGPVDGLVNVAGLWEMAPVERIAPEAWTRVLAANLQTTFAGCQAILPAMIERGSGSIVNVASTAGEYGSVRPASHYAAAKGGVIALTKSLAREASPHGVRVNAVSPGPIDTAALGATSEDDRVAIGSRTLLGRPGRPHEIASACVFLLSSFSGFVTGHVLRVNGGSLL